MQNNLLCFTIVYIVNSLCRMGQKNVILNFEALATIFIQFTHLRCASRVNSDIIKMAVTALLIRICIIVYYISIYKYVSQTKSFIV